MKDAAGPLRVTVTGVTTAELSVVMSPEPSMTKMTTGATGAGWSANVNGLLPTPTMARAVKRKTICRGDTVVYLLLEG